MADESSFYIEAGGLKGTQDAVVDSLNEQALADEQKKSEKQAQKKPRKKRQKKGTPIVPVNIPKTKYQSAPDYAQNFQTTDDPIEPPAAPEAANSSSSNSSQSTTTTSGRKRQGSRTRKGKPGFGGSSVNPTSTINASSVINNATQSGSQTNAQPGANSTGTSTSGSGSKMTDLLKGLGQIVMHLKNIDENVAAMKEMMENMSGGKGQGISADSFLKGKNVGDKDDSDKGDSIIGKLMKGLEVALALGGALLAAKFGGVVAQGIAGAAKVAEGIIEKGKGLLGIAPKVESAAAQAVRKGENFVQKGFSYAKKLGGLGLKAVAEDVSKLRPVEQVLDFVKPGVNAAKGVVQGGISNAIKAGNAIDNLGAQAFHKITTPFRNAYDGMSAGVQKVVRTVGGISLAGIGTAAKTAFKAMHFGVSAVGLAETGAHAMGAVHSAQKGRWNEAAENALLAGSDVLAYGGPKNMIRGLVGAVPGMGKVAKFLDSKSGKMFDSMAGKVITNGIKGFAAGGLAGAVGGSIVPGAGTVVGGVVGGVVGAAMSIAGTTVAAHAVRGAAQSLHGLDDDAEVKRHGLSPQRLIKNFKKNDGVYGDDVIDMIQHHLFPKKKTPAAKLTPLQPAEVAKNTNHLDAHRTAVATASAARASAGSGGGPSSSTSSATFNFNGPHIKSKDDAKQLIAQAFSAWQRAQQLSARSGERFSNLGQTNPSPLSFGFGLT